MRLEKDVLLGLAMTSLITILAAISILRPNALSVGALAGCSIVALIGIRREKTDTTSPHWRLESSKFLMSREWPGRTADPDKLVDHLVSSVEGYIKNIRNGGAPLEEAGMRKALHQRLGHVLEEVIGLPLGGKTFDVTVLLSDLRGFTTVTSGYSARDVVDILNRYFAHMCEIIYRYGGTVDKFMGDSIMALFGAPVSRPKDIEQALCCAAEMQIRMDTFNKENESLSLPHLYMGIGVNTGEVIAGKIGSDLHSEYTVIGDEVNLASRIEGYTLRGQILISQKTYSSVKDSITVKSPIQVSVKGKREPVLLYELEAIGEPYNLNVPDREARRCLRVDTNIPFKFRLCEGKVILPETYEGLILNFSTGGMLVATSADVESHSVLSFRLDEANILNMQSDDIFGMILKVNKEDRLYHVNIEFTSITPKDREAIGKLVHQLVQGTWVRGV